MKEMYLPSGETRACAFSGLPNSAERGMSHEFHVGVACQGGDPLDPVNRKVLFEGEEIIGDAMASGQGSVDHGAIERALMRRVFFSIPRQR